MSEVLFERLWWTDKDQNTSNKLIVQQKRHTECSYPPGGFGDEQFQV